MKDVKLVYNGWYQVNLGWGDGFGRNQSARADRW